MRSRTKSAVARHARLRLTLAAVAAVLLAGSLLADNTIVVTFSSPSLDKAVIPRNLAAGRGGTVWYTTERFTPHAVGRIAGGKVSEFPIPCDGCDSGLRITYIEDIVEGFDGSAYFPYTEVQSDGSPLAGGDNNYIGVLTPNATTFSFKKIRVPTVNAFRRYFNATGYASITAVPGGVCFSENAADKLGCLDAAGGKITEFALPKSSYPSGITYGFGAVWSVLSLSGKLARLQPADGTAGFTESGPMQSFDSATVKLSDVLPDSGKLGGPFLLDVAVSPDGTLVISDAQKKAVHSWSPWNDSLLETLPLGDGVPSRFASLPEGPDAFSLVVTNPTTGGLSARARTAVDLIRQKMVHYRPGTGSVVSDVAGIRRGSLLELWMSGYDAEFKDAPLSVATVRVGSADCTTPIQMAWKLATVDSVFAVSGRPLSDSVVATGGVPPYSFQIVDGQLPAGVSLDAAGSLTGTPPALNDDRIYDFTVLARDSRGCTGSRHLAVFVRPACVLLPLVSGPADPLPKGVPIDQRLTVWGQPPFTIRSASGLPLGLTLGTDSNGQLLLENAPDLGEKSGEYTVTVNLTDANGCSFESRFKVILTDPPSPPRRRPSKP